MTKSPKEIMVKGYIEDEDISLSEFRNEASEELIDSLKGTPFGPDCGACGGRLLYSSSRNEYFCPFCD